MAFVQAFPVRKTVSVAEYITHRQTDHDLPELDRTGQWVVTYMYGSYTPLRSRGKVYRSHRPNQIRVQYAYKPGYTQDNSTASLLRTHVQIKIL